MPKIKISIKTLVDKIIIVNGENPEDIANEIKKCLIKAVQKVQSLTLENQE